MNTKLALAALALAVVACSEANPPPPRTAAEIKSAPAPSPCPLGVEGARVVYEDTEQGGRLTFTAPPGKVEHLRQRARDAAAMHGPGQHLGEGHTGDGREARHGTGGEHGLRPMQMPPATAGEQDLEGGARIDVLPRYDGDLPELRAKLRKRAQELMNSCE